MGQLLSKHCFIKIFSKMKEYKMFMMCLGVCTIVYILLQVLIKRERDRYLGRSR